jgi:serine/threonine-protein kinase CLA4
VTIQALSALDHLQNLRIAPRDVRSDNMLINSAGVLKLSDFSNAVRADHEGLVCSEPAGVIYWQAPEVRRYRVLIMKPEDDINMSMQWLV